MKVDYEGYAKIIKAFSDPKRLQILDMISGGELCACKILERFQITQPTLSHDMKLLCDTGMVNARKEGKWTHYSLNEEKAKEVIGMLEEVLTKKETKLYILTGFLGSGKTTVLLKILEHLKGQRVGIIQNEFGKLSIDGKILRDDEIQMVEINRGSIFCSCLKLSFVNALAEMLEQNFDYLFVESSGWGDPSNVEEILKAVEIVANRSYNFQGVICLVDAVNFMEQLEDEECAYRQLKHCHLAVVTKTDIAEDEQIRLVEEKIREINPVCKIIYSEMGNLDMNFFQEDLLKYQWAEGEESTNAPETKPKSVYMEVGEAVEKEKLEAFLNEIACDMHRVKGFVNVNQIGWQQVDLVGRTITFQDTDQTEQGELVFISKIGPAAIKHIFSKWEEKVGTAMKLKN